MKTLKGTKKVKEVEALLKRRRRKRKKNKKNKNKNKN